MTKPLLEPMPRTRARIALTMLRTMAGYEPGVPQQSLTDVLTDLRHFADANRCDFHAALDLSYGHYLSERHEGSRHVRTRARKAGVA